MANQSNNKLNKWEINQIRFTAFPSPTVTIFDKPEEWWLAIAGDNPENISRSPQVGRTVITGTTQQGKLILDIQPNRIDWLLTIPENLPGIFTIGPFPTILTAFKSYIDKWFTLDTYPNLHRLAFGAQLFQDVKTKEEGYEKIASYLPDVTIDPINSSDFNYRINRPRKSKYIDNLFINRLSTWGVLTHMVLSIGLQNPQMRNYQQGISCSLQLDINTFDDYLGEFSGDNSPDIFAELIELGEEIVINGDIK